MKNEHQTMSKSQQGFTLIEVMVVVAIIGIMAGISIPNYLSWKPGYEFRGAVSRISSDLNRAKMRALETRRECRVMFCGNFYQIIDGNQTMHSNWEVPGGAPLYAPSGVNPGCPMTAAHEAAFEAANRRVTMVSLADYNLGAADVTSTGNPIFSPRGVATTLGTVTVKHPRSADEADIATNIAGRVRVVWK